MIFDRKKFEINYLYRNDIKNKFFSSMSNSTLIENQTIPGGDGPQETIPVGDEPPQDQVLGSVCPPAQLGCPNPRQLGFKLEQLIHDGLKKLDPTLKCLRENEIRKEYKTPSLFGIDHFVTKGNHNNIFIQDKWCETSSQTMDQVNQFVVGIQRLQKRIESTNQNTYIWAAKEKPGANALAVLKDFDIELIVCNTSVEALAQLVIDTIAKKLNLGTDVKTDEPIAVEPIVQPKYSENNLRLLCKGLLHGKKLSKVAITKLAGYSGKNGVRDFKKITTENHWTQIVATLKPEEIKLLIDIGSK